MRNSVRANDICARIGGDEFLIFMEYKDNIELLVDRVYQAIGGRMRILLSLQAWEWRLRRRTEWVMICFSSMRIKLYMPLRKMEEVIIVFMMIPCGSSFLCCHGLMTWTAEPAEDKSSIDNPYLYCYTVTNKQKEADII